VGKLLQQLPFIAHLQCRQNVLGFDDIGQLHDPVSV
jgi:hypothetical protein